MGLNLDKEVVSPGAYLSDVQPDVHLSLPQPGFSTKQSYKVSDTGLDEFGTVLGWSVSPIPVDGDLWQGFLFFLEFASLDPTVLTVGP